ncbi:MAG TPA: hypothetical protein VFT16_03800 [Candidatus Saccharimonadales bacterium]|nr:hypothetical protein [Candidatus Saccharimonadales bacterium]
MTEIIREGHIPTAEDDDFVDPWQVKAAQARDYLRSHKRSTIATTLALAVGLGGGILLGRGGSESADTTAPGRGNGVAAGPLAPGANESNPNTTPTQSSGGFNNAARVVLECTGLDIRLEPGTVDTFSATPVVTVKRGESTSPYLYTLLGTDTGHIEVVEGVNTLHDIKQGDNVEFPLVAIVDTAGTKFGPDDPEALSKPFGDAIPDQQIFNCPVVPYPEF